MADGREKLQALSFLGARKRKKARAGDQHPDIKTVIAMPRSMLHRDQSRLPTVPDECSFQRKESVEPSP